MGDFGQLPRTLVCVWTHGIHGWARGGEHLHEPEDDASSWTRKLCTVWWALIEAENVLRGLVLK